MYRTYDGSLFSTGDLAEFLSARQAALGRAVKELELDDLRSEAEVVAALTLRYAVEPLVIDTNARTIDTQETSIRFREQFSGRVVERDGVRVSAEIPYTGTSELLQKRPSTFRGSGTPIAQVRDRKLVLHRDVPGIPDADSTRQWIAADLETINWYVGNINNAVESYQKQLAASLPQMVAARKAHLEALRRLRDNLNGTDETAR